MLVLIINVFGLNTGPSEAKPTSDKPTGKPSPGGRDHHNIKNEDDKKEFFDSPEELEQKIDLLAK